MKSFGPVSPRYVRVDSKDEDPRPENDTSCFVELLFFFIHSFTAQRPRGQKPNKKEKIQLKQQNNFFSFRLPEPVVVFFLLPRVFLQAVEIKRSSSDAERCRNLFTRPERNRTDVPKIICKSHFRQ